LVIRCLPLVLQYSAAPPFEVEQPWPAWRIMDWATYVIRMKKIISRARRRMWCNIYLAWLTLFVNEIISNHIVDSAVIGHLLSEALHSTTVEDEVGIWCSCLQNLNKTHT
jgi:hypothetical protein